MAPLTGVPANGNTKRIPFYIISRFEGDFGALIFCLKSIGLRLGSEYFLRDYIPLSKSFLIWRDLLLCTTQQPVQVRLATDVCGSGRSASSYSCSESAARPLWIGMEPGTPDLTGGLLFNRF
jgi:hypothetical protein